MGLPTTGTYFSATCIYGSDDKSPFVNILWYRADTIIPPVDLQETADLVAIAVSNNVSDEYSNVLPSECQFYGVAARVYSNAVTADSSNTSAASAGDVSGDTCADFTAAVISKRSAQPGRSGRGRWYIGCVPESFTNTSRLTDSAVTAYTDLSDSFIANVSAGGVAWYPAIYSAKNSAFYDITGRKTRTALGTQRGRKFRVLL